MRWKFGAITMFVGLAALCVPSAHTQTTFRQLPVTKDAYVKPFAPLRIVGNLYYVGTYDLAVYLITTPAGHMLVNTGINNSVPAIRANIESLGFRFSDIKLLLATH